jgi:hypothetical protein
MSHRALICCVGCIPGVFVLAYAWLGKAEPASAPASLPAFSTAVQLADWDLAAEPGVTRVVEWAAEARIATQGVLTVKPADWSNVQIGAGRLSRQNADRPLLHVAARFARANGESVRIEKVSWLSHRKFRDGRVTFRGEITCPTLPGDYQLQLAVGEQPAIAALGGEGRWTWHVVAVRSVSVRN